METLQMLIAGFGGQGVLFMGKIIANKALLDDRQLSWLPSYGPEMRGGTANCSVIVSEQPIGSPIVTHPNTLVAMNLPSLDKYENAVVPGGKIFIDSTLISRKVERKDVTVYYVPATQMANEMGVPTLANMILLGKVFAACPELGRDHLQETMEHVVSAKHKDLLEANINAIEIGFNLK